MTKLGRLVKSGKIKSLEHIYLFSMPIKEYEIVDYFLGPPGANKLKDEVMKVQPVQKQTRAGQRTRFKAFVLVGDFDGHVGLGVKVGKEGGPKVPPMLDTPFSTAVVWQSGKGNDKGVVKKEESLPSIKKAK